MHEWDFVKSEGRLTQVNLPTNAGKGTAMLVLTRKADEQILIGDDIKITLVRVRGNSVRIGIDAPKNIRVVRGELAAKDAEGSLDPIVQREEVFARPDAQPQRTASSNRIATITGGPSDKGVARRNASLHDARPGNTRPGNASESFVKPASSPTRLENTKRAPLSEFVSAT